MISTYSGDLKSGLVWILNGQKEVGLQMVQISNGIWNPEAQLFEIQTNGRHFVKTFWNLDKNIQILNGPVFEMIGTIALAKPQPFEKGSLEIWPLKSLNFKCFRTSNGRISDPHCTQLKP